MRLMRFQRPDPWALAPLEQMNTLRAEINRLFQAPFGDLARTGEMFNGWAPALDLREEKDHLVATVELPGLKKENIEVSVHEGVLSISGERDQEKDMDDAGFYRAERFCGRFHRAVSLPKPVNLEAITASYKDGVLTVTMPKTEEAKPKQIEVSVGRD